MAGLILLLVFSNVKAQVHSSMYLEFGLYGIAPIQIEHNPLNKIGYTDQLESIPSLSPSIEIGYTIPIKKKFFVNTGLQYTKVPFRTRFKVHPVHYSPDETLFWSHRNNIVRNLSVPVSLNYIWSEDLTKNIDNLYIGLGLSLDIIKTYRARFRVGGHVDTIRYDIYKHVILDPLDYQENLNDRLYKYFLSYQLKCGFFLQKPLSRVEIELNYCPQKIGFGAFEFYNVDTPSEGYLTHYNNKMAIQYCYYLENIRNWRRKKK